MKTVSRILCVAAIAFAAKNSNAQATASASASATIITPIAISKTTDMNFGNVAVQASTGGTVVLPTVGARTRTSGVTLPAVTGTVAAAVFNVTGDGNRTYAITLPGSASTLSDGSSHSMTVDTFVADPGATGTPASTGTLSSGSQTVNVGATLNVSAGQTPGVYTGSFSVTVNYN